MSDGAAKRFREKEEFQILSSQSDLGKSPYQKHSLWMEHWARASSSAEPQSGKSCSPFEEVSDVGYSKDCGILPLELIKTRVAERLMLELSKAGASAGNTQQFSSKMWGVTHNVCQGVECKNVDQVDNLHAAGAVVSEGFSVHKLSDKSLKSCKVLGSENMISEWSHFPMFDINRKIDSILNPRRSPFGTSLDKSFVLQKDLKVNMSTGNVMTFSSKEYQFHSHRVTDRNTSRCKSAGGILSHPDNHTGLGSDHAGKKLKGHLSIEESCSCSKNETNLSCSLSDKRCTSNLIVDLKESPHCFTENNFMFPASKKENENVKRSLLEKKLGASGGCQELQGFEGVAYHGSVLSREYDMKSVNTSATSKGNDMETNGCGMVLANLLQCEQENLTTDRVDPSMKLTKSRKLPDTIENTVTVKSKDGILAGWKPPKDKLTNGKRKAPCLFEMFTFPSQSQAKCFKDPTSSGFPASSIQKNPDCQNKTKSEQKATSSIRRVSSCSGRNKTLNMSAENHNSYSKETCASKQEWSMSKTSSMNLDLVLFQISRMRNPISSALIKSPVCSGASDKWLKRLQHDISDPHFSCSKRPKIGDCPSPGGACTVFGQEFNFDMGKAVINCVKENELRYQRLMNQQTQEESPTSARSLNLWIGRWCQGGTPVYHGTSNAEKQTPKSNTSPDDLEGQFPSIAAMAMMGRVMNKLRPCELQKKGPSVVWKTQGS